MLCVSCVQSLPRDMRLPVPSDAEWEDVYSWVSIPAVDMAEEVLLAGDGDGSSAGDNGSTSLRSVASVGSPLQPRDPNTVPSPTSAKKTARSATSTPRGASTPRSTGRGGRGSPPSATSAASRNAQRRHYAPASQLAADTPAAEAAPAQSTREWTDDERVALARATSILKQHGIVGVGAGNLDAAEFASAAMVPVPAPPPPAPVSARPPPRRAVGAAGAGAGTAAATGGAPPAARVPPMPQPQPLPPRPMPGGNTAAGPSEAPAADSLMYPDLEASLREDRDSALQQADAILHSVGVDPSGSSSSRFTPEPSTLTGTLSGQALSQSRALAGDTSAAAGAAGDASRPSAVAEAAAAAAAMAGPGAAADVTGSSAPGAGLPNTSHYSLLFPQAGADASASTAARGQSSPSRVDSPSARRTPMADDVLNPDPIMSLSGVLGLSGQCPGTVTFSPDGSEIVYVAACCSTLVWVVGAV